ncbi:hypothetical protein OAF37_00225 [Rubripirellula sp.]|nr:hypothetical protein [Rubripirellula sp.]MDB4477434.1 hypothetical protein [Rhodopirellula sp.]MDB4644457.1 hypothetical protein [Rubripirellula sp.]
MQGQELTYAVLSRSRNDAAVEVLLACMDSGLQEHREMALSTLMQRRDERVPAKLLARWDQLRPSEHLLIKTRKSWFESAVSQALKHRGADTITAIAAAESLELTKFIPMLVDLAETSESDEIQQRATAATLNLAHILGGRARCDRDVPTLRNPALERLHKSLEKIDRQGNHSLADAFLVLSLWGDSELRKVMSEPSPVRKLVLKRFLESNHIGVLDLLAGTIKRRQMNKHVLTLIRKRSDHAFRSVLLNTITPDPSAVVLKNLSSIGMLACCSGDESLLAEINENQVPALLHLYVTSGPNPVQTLHMIAAVAEKKNPAYDSVVCCSLAQCSAPDSESIVRAALHIANDDVDLSKNQDAHLLQRLIALMDHQDENIVRGIQRVIQPLHAESMMHRFQDLRPRSRRILGRVVMMVDPNALQSVSDAIRHPFLKNRLAAIAMADALAVVDLLSDSFEYIVQEDHLEARISAAEVMANAHGDATWSVLKKLADLPGCPVRDIALNAIQRRSEQTLQS